MTREISKRTNTLYIIFHSISFIFAIFLRFFPGKDGSHNISNTWDKYEFGLGWWKNYIQWGFWVSLFYFGFSLIGDIFTNRNWRRHRDRFFFSTFSIQSSIAFCYWLIYVPMKGPTPIDSWHIIVEDYISTSSLCILLWIELFIIVHKTSNAIIELFIPLSFFLGFILFDSLRYTFTGQFSFKFSTPWGYWIAFIVAHVLFYLISVLLSNLIRKIRMKKICCSNLLYESDSEQIENVLLSLPHENFNYEKEYTCSNRLMPFFSMVISVIVINIVFLLAYLIADKDR